jgi:hypothetical protein
MQIIKRRGLVITLSGILTSSIFVVTRPVSMSNSTYWKEFCVPKRYQTVPVNAFCLCHMNTSDQCTHFGIDDSVDSLFKKTVNQQFTIVLTVQFLKCILHVCLNTWQNPEWNKKYSHSWFVIYTFTNYYLIINEHFWRKLVHDNSCNNVFYL